MRTSYLSSLIFALLASTSLAVTAAPAATPPEAAKPAMSAPAGMQDAKVNLNSASAETLQKELSGIGAAKANAIVAYREEHGGFTAVDELLEVKGIGKALLDKNRDKLSIN
ncbi:helix-hairpin-helix domain-containing protein [Pseudomonas sp. W2Oct36]|uniref:ComEA family DNA-binding protein n=1 Tax=unclassified Pseudomonas TaxID=196821 RepID=UPI00177D8CC5|nr:helix-hairpin-helix domain-containing protein [Pseudomonas sp. CFBP 8772]MBD8599284.1 helix-hairpin-helix domain-containing protein [Pseudomonas sp. CFBP 8772]